uniref:Uncharacterized protein n=1 Tax=Chrysotila carterae TaxID=13221 RepID=A0A7S4BDB8_CHRCT|mmetsp:Transcript_25570/g.53535  ORF Transcript_25570/g.53535 Transcript_25570/m.53535 type:complete len:105 (-) Transcript_25570:395-709(-)
MAKQYSMYNVQGAEMWKQRISRENNFNAPVPPSSIGGDDDDKVSMMSGSTRMTSVSRARKSDVSVASTATMRKIEELEKRLEDERRKRESVESQLKQYMGGSVP